MLRGVGVAGEGALRPGDVAAACARSVCCCESHARLPCTPPARAQVGKETGGKKLEGPHALKANEMAEVVFEPCQPLVVDSFRNCEGLSRIAFLDGNTAVMLGKVVSTNSK